MTEANDSSNHLPGCSRRDAIRQLLYMGAVASVAQTALDAQVPPTIGRVDLHHHFYATTPLLKKFTADLPNPEPIFAYTAARSLEAMDQADASTAMLSCPMTFGDDPAAVRQDARVCARETNEYGAKLVSGHRGRFGLSPYSPCQTSTHLSARLSTRLTPLEQTASGWRRVTGGNGSATTGLTPCSRS